MGGRHLVALDRRDPATGREINGALAPLSPPSYRCGIHFEFPLCPALQKVGQFFASTSPDGLGLGLAEFVRDFAPGRRAQPGAKLLGGHHATDNEMVDLPDVQFMIEDSHLIDRVGNRRQPNNDAILGIALMHIAHVVVGSERSNIVLQRSE
jgi:hypothetical protein